MNSGHVRVGLEHCSDNRCLAWAFDFPGAFAYGSSDAEAFKRLPEALATYRYWIGQHTDQNWVKQTLFEPQVEEKVDAFPKDESNAINAFFKDDRQPLEGLEIERALLIHTWQRQDLLATVNNLTPELMTRILPGERWNINGILNHVGRTETRYLGYLDLPLPTTELLVHNPFKILELSYELVQTSLAKLAGNKMILEQDGGLWSARKLVRRLLWHQRDHIEHIHQIVEMANQQ